MSKPSFMLVMLAVLTSVSRGFAIDVGLSRIETVVP